MLRYSGGLGGAVFAALDRGSPTAQLAIAFVLRHPAVTAAIIGPRTMEHLESQMAAANVEVPDDIPTASTRSCRPARPSTPPTAGGSARTCSRRRDAGRPP
ncbi:MAG TPA: aldo/keto reductase [Streptosporangiaceae bacterium]